MNQDSSGKKQNSTRLAPRVVASVDVNVEVAGERKTVRLVSKDIGSGGLFLRTETPASLFKHVTLFLPLPNGDVLQMSGEVVRSISKEQSLASGYPAGMAIAFDDTSRPKQKELVALVLDVCANKAKVPESTQPTPQAKKPASSKPIPTKADDLLNQIDDLLDSVGVATTKNKPAINTPLTTHKTNKTQTTPQATLPSDKRVESTTNSAKQLSIALSNYRKTRKGDTYYDILGVSLKASSEEIQAAYKKLVSNFKPAGSPESIPSELLQDISAVLGKVRKAYAILSKPDRKRAYDFLIDNNGDEA